MDTTTARYWLKRDHYKEWIRWWPTADALFAEMQAERDPNRTSSRPVVLPLIDADAIAAEHEEEARYT